MLSAETLLSPHAWAHQTFGKVELGDPRRRRRLLSLAEALARDPAATFPQAMSYQAEREGAYRFLDSPHIHYEDLLRPCMEQTHQAACECGATVLLLQDTTECDHASHPTTTGLGPVGNGSHHGFFVHSVLVVRPDTRAVLGLVHQEAFLRQPAPEGESSRQRSQREQRETMVWTRAVEAIGSPPSGVRFVHVGDRGADLYPLLLRMKELGTDFTIRACKDRNVDLLVHPDAPPPPRRSHQRGAKPVAPPQHLFAVCRAWPEQACIQIELKTTQKRKGRTVQAAVSFGRVRLLPPLDLERLHLPALVVWVVRVWEPKAPDGVEPLEWVLLTSVPVEGTQAALVRVQWYRARWIIEDYHQCLKTGCGLEKRHLHDYEGLHRLLGVLAPLAVRLLQLRSLAQAAPQTPAREVVSHEVVVVVAHLSGLPVATMTAHDCLRALAQQGGYFGRKGDGPPGWKTLWRGWLKVQSLLEGIHLSHLLSDQLNL